MNIIRVSDASLSDEARNGDIAYFAKDLDAYYDLWCKKGNPLIKLENVEVMTPVEFARTNPIWTQPAKVRATIRSINFKAVGTNVSIMMASMERELISKVESPVKVINDCLSVDADRLQLTCYTAIPRIKGSAEMFYSNALKDYVSTDDLVYPLRCAVYLRPAILVLDMDHYMFRLILKRLEF